MRGVLQFYICFFLSINSGSRFSVRSVFAALILGLFLHAGPIGAQTSTPTLVISTNPAGPLSEGGNPKIDIIVTVAGGQIPQSANPGNTRNLFLATLTWIGGTSSDDFIFGGVWEAVSGESYQYRSLGGIQLSPGDNIGKSQGFVLGIKDDTIIEPQESFRIDLIQTEGTVKEGVDLTSLVVTIQDNDFPALKCTI